MTQGFPFTCFLRIKLPSILALFQPAGTPFPGRVMTDRDYSAHFSQNSSGKFVLSNNAVCPTAFICYFQSLISIEELYHFRLSFCNSIIYFESHIFASFDVRVTVATVTSLFPYTSNFIYVAQMLTCPVLPPGDTH